MNKKFYAVLLLFFFTGLVPALAQRDSTNCNARFYVQPYNLIVMFRAADSLPGLQHSWIFGDSSETGYYNFPMRRMVIVMRGTYRVVHLIRNTTTGCFDSSSQSVTVGAVAPNPCSVSISSQRDTLDHQLYHFTATPNFSGGMVDTVSWTINNVFAGLGDTLVRRLPAGAYTICATVTTSLGCRSQNCLSMAVTDSLIDSIPQPPPPPPGCTVDFTAIPSPGNAEQYTFSLRDSAAYDSVNWLIRVRSGMDSVALKQATGRSFTYTFPHPGFYDVLVFARADSGNQCYVFSMQRIDVDSAAMAASSYIASYPNPAASQVGVDVKLTQPTMIYVQIYNSMGNPVLSTSVSGYTGTNHVNLPLGNLGTGIYYIQVEYGNVIKRSKVQKL